MGELYKLYAALHPQSRSLWNVLASEEQEHADILASLHKQLDAGYLFWNIGLFRPEMIAEEVAFVRAAVEQARSGTPTEAECIATATRIELSVIESKFFSTVKSEAKEFTFICQALNDATAIHLQRLKAKIAEQPFVR